MALGDESTAFHEAGHAVVAHVLGVEIDYVSIVRVGDSAGHVRPRRGKPGAILGMYFAGGIAEVRAVGESHADHMAAAYDEACAVGWAMKHYGADYEEHIEAFRKRAANEVDENWPAIQRVAAALLERGTLTADDLAAVIS